MANTPPESAETLSAAQRDELAHLRAQAAQLFTLRDLTLDLALPPNTAQPYTFALPADPNAPLDQFAAEQQRQQPHVALAVDEMGEQVCDVATRQALRVASDEARETVATGVHMPYWGLLWPSGIALAAAVLASTGSVQGRRVLELGCGLGITATAALDAGADLWAADCFAEALLFTRHNALRNTARTPHPLRLDWRTEAGRAACRAVGPVDVLLAADVLYEQENLEPLLTLVPQVLMRGGVFWLAEPGRRVSRAFVAQTQACGWRDEVTLDERRWPPDDDLVQVAVHRLMLP